MNTISREDFQQLLGPVINFIAGKQLDKNLENDLNTEFPKSGKVLNGIKQSCHDAITAGWMCKYEGGGIKYGRVIKPGPETADYSVDVVWMKDMLKKASNSRMLYFAFLANWNNFSVYMQFSYNCLFYVVARKS